MKLVFNLILLIRTLSRVPRQEQVSQLWCAQQSSSLRTSCNYKIIPKKKNIKLGTKKIKINEFEDTL